jgi:hypothetical protein
MDQNDDSNRKEPPKVTMRTTIKVRPSSCGTYESELSVPPGSSNIRSQLSYSPTTIYASSSQLQQVSPQVLRPDIHNQMTNLLVNQNFQRPRSALSFADNENFNYFPSSERISTSANNDILNSSSKAEYYSLTSLDNDVASTKLFANRSKSPASRLESIKRRKHLDYLNSQRYSYSNNSDTIHRYSPVVRSRSNHANTQTDVHLDPFVSTKTGCLPDFAETETASFYYNEDPLISSHISRVLSNNSVLTSSSPCLPYVYESLKVVHTGERSLQRSPHRSPVQNENTTRNSQQQQQPVYRSVSTSMQSLLDRQQQKQAISTQTSPDLIRRKRNSTNVTDTSTPSPTSDSEGPRHLARTKTTAVFEKSNNSNAPITVKESFSIKNNRKNKNNIKYTQSSEYQEINGPNQSRTKYSIEMVRLIFFFCWK